MPKQISINTGWISSILNRIHSNFTLLLLQLIKREKQWNFFNHVKNIWWSWASIHNNRLERIHLIQEILLYWLLQPWVSLQILYLLFLVQQLLPNISIPFMQCQQQSFVQYHFALSFGKWQKCLKFSIVFKISSIKVSIIEIWKS